MLPIIAGSCPQVKVIVSSPQWDILETGLCIEREVVRFTRNDSRSVLGENWAFHNPSTALQTAVWAFDDLGGGILTLRVMTPAAPQRAALQKHG